jgi:hypothetical protein
VVEGRRKEVAFQKMIGSNAVLLEFVGDLTMYGRIHLHPEDLCGRITAEIAHPLACSTKEHATSECRVAYCLVGVAKCPPNQEVGDLYVRVISAKGLMVLRPLYLL